MKKTLALLLAALTLLALCSCGVITFDEPVVESKPNYCDENSHKWVEATCETPKTCSVCGKTEGRRLGHDYEDNVCTRCGEYNQPLYITDYGHTSSSNYLTVYGSVKNFTKSTYQFVTIKVVFYDSSDNIIDSDYTYAVGAEGISPGASAQWELMYNKSRVSPQRWTMEVMDYSLG